MITLKHRGTWLFLLLLIVAYAAIVIIQSLGNPDEEIQIYFADRMTPAHRVLIDRYNQINEGKIKVIPIDFPNFDFSTNERKEVLARSLRGTGDGIDLFAVDLIWVQRFAKWAEKLDPYFSQEEKKRLLNSALEDCYYDGELVAVPLNMVQSMIYYRSDILSKMQHSDQIVKKLNDGITWEDFIQLRNQFNSANPFYVFTGADYEGLICVYMQLLLSIKPNYFQEYGFYLNTPEARKALQLLVDFVHRYELSPNQVTNFTEVSSYEYFIKNDGLFIQGWPSFDKDFEETPFDPAKEKNLKKAPLPRFKDGKAISVFGGWNVMVSKFSNKKKEVIDFVKYLLSDSSQEIFYIKGGYYPVFNKFYESEEYIVKYPEIPTIKKMLATGKHRPAHEDYTKFSKIMSMFFEQAISQQVSVDEALKKATEAIQIERKIITDYWPSTN
jgi:multiple sugar transport system substrate-binding protein